MASSNSVKPTSFFSFFQKMCKPYQLWQHLKRMEMVSKRQLQKFIKPTLVKVLFLCQYSIIHNIIHGSSSVRKA